MKRSRFLFNPFVTGTLLLTLTGVLSRIIGFFYRIFLSRTIGAEGLGIYQLIFPILTLCVSLTAAGVQTAISKFVSEERGKCNNCSGLRYLYAGLFLSLCLSVLVMIFLLRQAQLLSDTVLHESRCGILLCIMAYSLPFTAIHSCINGYYYGLKKTAVPSFSQLLEQGIRVGAVYMLYLIAREQNLSISPAAAVWGLVCGDIAATLYSLTALSLHKKALRKSADAAGGLKRNTAKRRLRPLKQLGFYCIPLTANRVTINLFSSIEAILIPAQLQLFGYNNSDALSVFGILTGMAMPMILFPNVLTSSVSVLLLPTISEAQSDCNRTLIVRAIKKTVEYCMILGLFSTLVFLLTGDYIGQIVFKNTLAGTFITTLSWICPFSNLATTLASILNGLGKASHAFGINLLGSLIRILFVLVFVPVYGIRSYLYGMLVSQLFIAAAAILTILYLNKHGLCKA